MENTCGNCKYLKHSDMMGLKTAYCGHEDVEDLIIPHQSKLENGKRGDNTVMTFTRIPMFCPRTDVVKSNKPAPAKSWVNKTILY